MEEKDTGPWWDFGYVWLVISGPVAVIIASFITLFFAVNSSDPVIDDYYRKGLEINKTLDAPRDDMVPALQGRNHAATGMKRKDD